MNINYSSSISSTYWKGLIVSPLFSLWKCLYLVTFSRSLVVIPSHITLKWKQKQPQSKHAGYTTTNLKTEKNIGQNGTRLDTRPKVQNINNRKYPISQRTETDTRPQVAPSRAKSKRITYGRSNWWTDTPLIVVSSRFHCIKSYDL